MEGHLEVQMNLGSLLRGELFQWRHLSNWLKPTFSFKAFLYNMNNIFIMIAFSTICSFNI